MSRPESQVLKFGGRIWETYKAITNAVLARGGNDSDVRRILQERAVVNQIAELIVGKSADAASALQIARSATLAWVIGACRFTYVNENITAEHFPFQPGDFTMKDVEIVKINRDMSTQKVLKFLDEQGLRPATLMELLWWWLTHPAEQSDCLVVALGSVWSGLVPYVHGYGADRALRLNCVAVDWNADCRFAAVRKDKAT